jgi:hypothetical protein
MGSEWGPEKRSSGSAAVMTSKVFFKGVIIRLAVFASAVRLLGDDDA